MLCQCHLSWNLSVLSYASPCDALWLYKVCVKPYLYHKIQAAKLKSKYILNEDCLQQKTQQKMLVSIAITNFEKIVGFLRIQWYVL